MDTIRTQNQRPFGLTACWAFIALTLSFYGSASPQVHRVNGHQFSTGPVPVWVQTGIEANLPAPIDSKESVYYALVEEQAWIDDQTTDVYRRNVEQPLTTEGLETSSKIEVSFNPAFQTLIWHDVKLIRNGKTLNKLDPSRITLLQREEDLDSDIVDGSLTAVVMVDGTRKGDLIEYAFTIRGRNPVYGPHRFYSSRTGWSVPTGKVFKRIVWDNQRPAYLQQYRMQQPVEVQRGDKHTEYRWVAENTPSNYLEKNTPSWFNPYPTLYLTSFADWKAVSNWAELLYQQQHFNNAELTALVERLRPLPADKQVTEALAYVQGEIRYLGVELGINSHLPRGPDTVVQQRYGDCKDKTLLLMAILKPLGINAYPVLVSSYGGEDLPDLPASPNLFDHVITRVELGDEVFWLDPTLNTQQGSLRTLGYYSYDHALVVGHPTVDLVPMPSTSSTKTSIHTTETFNVLAYGAPVDYTIETVYQGAEADYMRRQFARRDLREMAMQFSNYMLKLYPSLSVARPMTIEDQSGENRFIVREFYRLGEFFDSRPELMVAHLYAYSLSNYLATPEAILREQPMRFFEPVRVEHTARIEYPEYFDMSLRNHFESIDTPYFSINVTEDYQDLAIVTHHRLDIKKNYLPADDVKEHAAQLRKAKDLLGQSYETFYQNGGAAEAALSQFIQTLNSHVDRLGGRP